MTLLTRLLRKLWRAALQLATRRFDEAGLNSNGNKAMVFSPGSGRLSKQVCSQKRKPITIEIQLYLVLNKLPVETLEEFKFLVAE